jgi:hypothetical protein
VVFRIFLLITDRYKKIEINGTVYAKAVFAKGPKVLTKITKPTGLKPTPLLGDTIVFGN